MTPHTPDAHTISLQGLTASEWSNRSELINTYIKRTRPHNWSDYLNVAIKEARRAGATEMVQLGAGFEGIVYDLKRNGKPLWTALRIQTGSVPHPRVDGTLPFYSDEQFYFPGDPESGQPYCEPMNITPSRLGKESYIYAKGVRITLMPKVIPQKLLIDDLGYLQEGVVEADLDHHEILTREMGALLAGQGYPKFDDHAKNCGYYPLTNDLFVPVVFDPGPSIVINFPESVVLGSANDRQRYKNAQQSPDRDIQPWTSRDIWEKLRHEITKDASRLQSGEPTAFALRMQHMRQDALDPQRILCQLAGTSNAKRR